MNEVEPIDPDLAHLLDAERSIQAPADRVQARMFARLEGVLPPLGPGGGSGGGGAGGGGAAAAPRAAAKLAGSGAAGKALASIALLAVGAVGGAGIHAAVSGSGGSGEHALVAAPPRIVVSLQLPAAEPPVAPSAVAQASAVPSNGERAAPETVARGETLLKAERLVLATARTALGRGDTESALAAVERHAREYPRGQLSEEREVLRVQVLKAAGNDAGARERAAAFKRSFPKSMMQDAVDQAAAPKAKR